MTTNRGIGKQRARSEDDKAARRRHLLDAAEQLLGSIPYEQLALATVARAAGLSKASAYTYFPTKESLFLALLERRLTHWITTLADRIGRRTRTPRTLARTIAESLADDGLTRALLGRLHATLETNVPDAEVLAFKRFLASVVAQGGALVEHAVPALPAGQGEHLLLLTCALVIGLGTLSERSDNVARALEADLELSRRFDIDFSDELSNALEALIASAMARAAE